MAAHGTRSRYREGCRCTTCKEAQAAYYQQRRDGGGAVKALVAPGPVEVATAAQLASMSRAAVEPALAAGALEMARLLDGDKAISAKPTAMKQLCAVLSELRKGSDVRKSGLARVRSMSKGDLGATG